MDGATSKAGQAHALSGLRVLEFGSLIAGPLCSRVLADFGAEVIKIELPGEGDPLRHWGQEPYRGRDLLWTIYARNKKCVSIDLRLQAGQELARKLASTADVIVENFRPGTMEKWGLGPSDLEQLNPDLVFVRISGFGQTGPYSHKAGFGSVAEAMGGIRYTTGYPDRPPTRTGVSLGDSLAALFGTIGALVALLHRERTRRNGLDTATGQTVDVAIYESVFGVMESLIPDFVLQGRIRERTGAVLPHVAPSNVYSCSDGVDVIIAANADNPFRRLCEVMGQPELAGDPRFATHQARGEHQQEIDEIIENWTKSLTSQEVVERLDEAGVPCGKIYTAREMVEDPHYQAREMIQSVVVDEGFEFPMPSPLPILTRTPGAIRWAGPKTVGSHTDEVLGESLGLSNEELTSLREAGVIQ